LCTADVTHRSQTRRARLMVLHALQFVDAHLHLIAA
jgi:hypothetical protein